MSTDTPAATDQPTRRALLSAFDKTGMVDLGRALVELGWELVSSGGTRPYRVHFRDPSFNNLQSVAAMCEGSMISDVIAAVASIDPVMGGVDR